MPIKITTPNAVMPVSQAQALGHLRVDASEWDLVSVYLAAAVAYVEDYTARATTTKGYTLYLDRWPQRSNFYGVGSAATGLYYGYGMAASGSLFDPKHYPNLLALELRRTPLVAITSVKYFPEDGSALATYAADSYRVDTFSIPGRLVFVDGSDLPATAKRADAVQVEFTAGIGATAADVLSLDPIMVMGILFTLTNYYENRVPILDRGMPLPFGLKDILRNRRVDSMTPELQ